MSSTFRRSRSWTLAGAVLSALLGALVSLLLYLRGADDGGPWSWLAALCGRAGSSGCEIVARSELAAPFGVSLALVGVVFYGVLLVLVAGVWLFGPRPGLAWLLALAALGLVVDAGLLSYSLFGLGTLCNLCALTYAATLASVACAFVLWRAEESSGERSAHAPPRPLLAFAAAGALAVFSATGWLAERAAPATPARFLADPDRALRLAWDAFLAHYRAVEPVRIAAKSAPRKGAARPVLELVLFADFACSHCERAAKLLSDFVERHRESSALVFKHYPLDDECNPESERIHPGACQLARAAVSAGLQHQFWRLHELLFANRELWLRGVSAPQLVALADQAGLDTALFQAALDSAAARAAVAADVSEAEALGVTGTPTLFINGRRMPSIPIPTFLEELLRSEAEQQAGFGAEAVVERGASE